MKVQFLDIAVLVGGHQSPLYRTLVS